MKEPKKSLRAIIEADNARLTRDNRNLRSRNEQLELENAALRAAFTVTDTFHDSVRKAMKKVKK
jgi:hypothetical protein